MAVPMTLDTLISKPPVQASATDVQKRWRRVLSDVRQSGCVVIKNHGDVEAVVFSPVEAERLQAELVELRARVQELDRAAPSPVEQLRERFRARIGQRDEAAFSGRLRAAASKPVNLGGRLKVGDRY